MNDRRDRQIRFRFRCDCCSSQGLSAISGTRSDSHGYWRTISAQRRHSFLDRVDLLLSSCGFWRSSSFSRAGCYTFVPVADYCANIGETSSEQGIWPQRTGFSTDDLGGGWNTSPAGLDVDFRLFPDRPRHRHNGSNTVLISEDICHDPDHIDPGARSR